MTEDGLPGDALRTDPPSVNEDVAKLRLELRDYSLAQLEERGIVTWDRKNHIVRKGPYFGETYPLEED